MAFSKHVASAPNRQIACSAANHLSGTSFAFSEWVSARDHRRIRGSNRVGRFAQLSEVCQPRNRSHPAGTSFRLGIRHGPQQRACAAPNRR